MITRKLIMKKYVGLFLICACTASDFFNSEEYLKAQKSFYDSLNATEKKRTAILEQLTPELQKEFDRLDRGTRLVELEKDKSYQEIMNYLNDEWKKKCKSYFKQNEQPSIYF